MKTRYLIPCLLALLAAVVGFASCTRTVYVPEVHTEYRDRVKYDSVVRRDSVVVIALGDTIFVYRDRWRDRWHVQRDTIRVRDSVAYPVEVVEVREVRHVPALYRWSLWIAIAAVGLALWRLRGVLG